MGPQNLCCSSARHAEPPPSLVRWTLSPILQMVTLRPPQCWTSKVGQQVQVRVRPGFGPSTAGETSPGTRARPGWWRCLPAFQPAPALGGPPALDSALGVSCRQPCSVTGLWCSQRQLEPGVTGRRNQGSQRGSTASRAVRELPLRSVGRVHGGPRAPLSSIPWKARLLVTSSVSGKTGQAAAGICSVFFILMGMCLSGSFLRLLPGEDEMWGRVGSGPRLSGSSGPSAWLVSVAICL